MPEPINPYQAPAAAESLLMTARQIAPNKKMRRLVMGLGVFRAAMFLSAAYIIGVYGGEFLAFALHSWGASNRVLTLANALRDVAHALGVVGALLCLAAPSESKALAWIQASAITGILAWVVRGLEYAPGIVDGTFYLRQALEYGSTAAAIVFLLKLCGWLGRSDFAHRAANLLKLLGVAVGRVRLLSLFRSWPSDFSSMFQDSTFFSGSLSATYCSSYLPSRHSTCSAPSVRKFKPVGTLATRRRSETMSLELKTRLPSQARRNKPCTSCELPFVHGRALSARMSEPINPYEPPAARIGVDPCAAHRAEQARAQAHAGAVDASLRGLSLPGLGRRGMRVLRPHLCRPRAACRATNISLLPSFGGRGRVCLLDRSVVLSRDSQGKRLVGLHSSGAGPLPFLLAGDGIEVLPWRSSRTQFCCKWPAVLRATVATYMFYVRLARWLRRDDLAERAVTLLKIVSAAIVCAVLYLVLNYSVAHEKLLPFQVLLLARIPGDILNIVLSIRAIQLLGALRAEIRFNGAPANNVPEQIDGNNAAL